MVDEHNNVVEWENGGNRVIELDPKIVRVFFDDHGRNYTVKTSDIFRVRTFLRRFEFFSYVMIL